MTADEVLGLTFFALLYRRKTWSAGRPAELMRRRRSVAAWKQEGWRVRKDGSRFWADIVLTAIRDSTGELIGYAKVTRDFTDRKRAEEAVMLQLSSASAGEHGCAEVAGGDFGEPARGDSARCGDAGAV